VFGGAYVQAPSRASALSRSYHTSPA